MEDASHRKSGFANNSSTNIEINEAGEASNIAGGNINLVQHQHNYFSPFQNRSSREEIADAGNVLDEPIPGIVEKCLPRPLQPQLQRLEIVTDLSSSVISPETRDVSVQKIGNSNVAAGDIFFIEKQYNFYSPHQKQLLPTRNLPKQGENLLDLLRKHAKRDCSNVPVPVPLSHSLVPVKLQIVKKPLSLKSEFENTGHWRRRKDFMLLYSQPDGDISDNEMFDYCKKLAAKSIPDDCETQQEIEEYLAVNGNILGVVGNPGIGKTTSTKKWVNMVLGGELIKNATYVFMIFVRRINFSVKMNVLQFLLSPILPSWRHSPDSDQYWIDEILNDRNVFIAIDGLDEAAVHNLTVNVPMPNLYAPADPLHILLNLINGKLLPYARIILTSRPNQFFHLHFEHRPKNVVQILGLDENGKDKLGRQICLSRYEKIKQTLLKNAATFAYCNVPVNFILTVHYLMTTKNDAEFVSMTKILSAASERYSRGEQLKGKIPSIDKLSELAWNGFRDKQVTFGDDDFKTVSLDDVTVQSFLSTSLVDLASSATITVLDGDKKSYFPHLIWQEFFAAVYLMLIAPLNEFCEALKLLFDDRWEVVAKFLYGLCSSSVQNLSIRALNIHLSVSDDRKLLQEKKRWLLNAAAVYLQQQQQNFQEPQLKTNGNNAVELEKIQHVCSWVHEANDSDVTAAIVPLLPVCVMLSKTILPSDISNLFYVLRSTDKSWNLKVMNCKFAENAMKQFCTEVADSKIQVQNFSLANKPMKNEDIFSLLKCLPQISQLSLTKCDITDHMVEALAKKLRQANCSVRLVDLSNNKIGERGFSAIFSSLENIQELKLRACGLSSKEMKIFEKRMIEKKQKMRNLDFSQNPIGDKGFSAIINSLQNITETLNLRNCGISKAEMEKFAKKLNDIGNTIHTLNLSGNPIEDAGFFLIADSLQGVKKLSLLNCGITKIGLARFPGRLMENENKVHTLDLSINKIGDEGFFVIIKFLENIEDTLLVRNCGISSRGTQKLAEKMIESKSKLGTLDLSFNKFGDEGVLLLLIILNRVKKLLLTDCNITYRSVERIAEKLVETNHQLEHLALSGNPICDKGCQSLLPCLRLIDSLWLGGCNITKEWEKKMANELQKLGLPKGRVCFPIRVSVNVGQKRSKPITVTGRFSVEKNDFKRK